MIADHIPVRRSCGDAAVQQLFGRIPTRARHSNVFEHSRPAYRSRAVQESKQEEINHVIVNKKV